MQIQRTVIITVNANCYESITGMSYVMCRLPHPDGGRREVWFEDPSPIYGEPNYVTNFISNEFSQDGNHEIVGSLWFTSDLEFNVQWFVPSCDAGATHTTELDLQSFHTTTWECL